MTRVIYTVFDAVTGEIRQCVECQPDQMLVAEGEDFIEGIANGATQYVDVKTRTLRPKRRFSLGQLPVPCTVIIEGQRYHCTTQPEFEFDVPGTYLIEVDAGPHYIREAFSYAYPPSGA